MAKSSRASVIKANRTAFRKKISGPVEDARAERLSTKLMQLASKPVPNVEEKMETENITTDPMSKDREKIVDEAVMDIDGQAKTTSHMSKKSANKTPSRIQKKRRGKPHAQISFPSTLRKGQRAQQQKKGRK